MSAPSAVVLETQRTFWRLKDELSPVREMAEMAEKAASEKRSDALYLEHKLHSLAWFLDEECDTTEYFVSIVDVLTMSKADCPYCAEDRP